MNFKNFSNSLSNSQYQKMYNACIERLNENIIHDFLKARFF